MLFLWWHLNLARLHDWMLGCWEMLLVSRFGAIPNVDSLFYIFPWSSPFFRPLKTTFFPAIFLLVNDPRASLGNDLWIFFHRYFHGGSMVFFPLKKPKDTEVFNPLTQQDAPPWGRRRPKLKLRKSRRAEDLAVMWGFVHIHTHPTCCGWKKSKSPVENDGFSQYLYRYL